MYSVTQQRTRFSSCEWQAELLCLPRPVDVVDRVIHQLMVKMWKNKNKKKKK